MCECESGFYRQFNLPGRLAACNRRCVLKRSRKNLTLSAAERQQSGSSLPSDQPRRFKCEAESFKRAAVCKANWHSGYFHFPPGPVCERPASLPPVGTLNAGVTRAKGASLCCRTQGDNGHSSTAGPHNQRERRLEGFQL